MRSRSNTKLMKFLNLQEQLRFNSLLAVDGLGKSGNELYLAQNWPFVWIARDFELFPHMMTMMLPLVDPKRLTKHFDLADYMHNHRGSKGDTRSPSLPFDSELGSFRCGRKSCCRFEEIFCFFARLTFLLSWGRMQTEMLGASTLL